jgi:hypothetical protein
MAQHRLLRLGALCLGFLASAPAASQTSKPQVRFPIAQPAPLAARVALLEQKLYAMDQRMRAFESVRLQSASDGAYAIAVNGAEVVIAKDGSVTVTPSRSSVGKLPESKPAADDCDPPYRVDSKGIKSIKPNCPDVARPCEPPFTVDQNGLRIPKQECL